MQSTPALNPYHQRLANRERRDRLKKEVLRLFVDDNVSNSEIARRLNLNPFQSQRWLVHAGVFKTNKEAGYARAGIKVAVQNPETIFLRALVKSYRSECKCESKGWEAVERAWNFRECGECKTLYVAATAASRFCSQRCVSKNYYVSNNKIITEKYIEKSKSKAKQKYESELPIKQSAYAAKKPTCQFCKEPIPFEKFCRSPHVKFCSEICGDKSQLHDYVHDPIKSARRKIIRARTYAKRQLNGKNLAEKRKYYQNNVQAVIAKNLRTRLYQAVKKAGGRKSASTLELTGADWPTLAAWLQNLFQPGMNWNNYGRWHVDHVAPCSSFNLTSESEQRECFFYKNLQPLWGIDNIRKGDKIIPALLAA